jgi:PleD family two-component response regulator
VTLSIGVAAGGSDDTLESLLARADAALYAAKRAGRNRVVDANEEPVAAAATR